MADTLLLQDSAKSPVKKQLRTKASRLTALIGKFEQLDRAFCISVRGSNLTTEVRAGITSFLAAGSNFVVNAHIMSHAGLNTKEVVVNAAFVCGFANIACGVLSNLPLGLMPGLGPNIVLAFGLVANHVCSTEQALAISITAGVLLLLFALTPINKLFIGLVPLSVRYGLIIGTGLLSAFIGLKAAGVVVPDAAGANIVALGSFDSMEAKICFVFLVVIVSLLHCAVKGAVLMGMLGATLTVWASSGQWPSAFSLGLPSTHSFDFSILLNAEAWVNIFALDLMLRFSICGALMSSARMAELMRPDGGVNGGTSVYVCCGVATIVSGALGSSPVFVSMAASAGVQDGGRTGIVSIVVGICCLLTSLLLSPLVSDIPKCAIAPVLLLVGVSMMGEAAHIEWKKIDRALPAFLCAIFQPFTFSVAHGINAGLGMSVVLFFTTGQFIHYMPKMQNFVTSLGFMVDSIDETLSPKEFQFSRQTSPLSPKGFQFTRQTSPRSYQEALDAQARPAPQHAQHAQLLGSGEDPTVDPSLSALRIRRPLHAVGVGARHNAEALVDQVAELLGFDKEAVHAIFEERLETGRHNNYTLYKEQCAVHTDHTDRTDIERAIGS